MASGQDPETELATFLRSRRQRLSPQEVGLPSTGRRRTPGLRREEVAVLAGVSTTWYTYLEQGRGRDVSPSVLNSIARVLRFTEDERRHIHILAFGHVIGARPLSEEVPITDLVRQMTAMVDDHPYPLYVTNRATDLIAWNRAAAEWYDDWSRLPEKDHNFLLWLLTEDKAKNCLVDWEGVARNVVARWRTDVAIWPTNSLLQDRIRDLEKRSPDFRRWWVDHEVLEHRTGVRRMRHPQLGIRDWRIVPMISFYEASPGVIFHLPA